MPYRPATGMAIGNINTAAALFVTVSVKATVLMQTKAGAYRDGSLCKPLVLSSD
ncbi:MAG: hypothetical protein LAT80_09950 [Balneolaceae bacterium]|nr:hypothetical protein [Balneolaceae bacterium]